jgi:hypothetical protein
MQIMVTSNLQAGKVTAKSISRPQDRWLLRLQHDRWPPAQIDPRRAELLVRDQDIFDIAVWREYEKVLRWPR